MILSIIKIIINDVAQNTARKTDRKVIFARIRLIVLSLINVCTREQIAFGGEKTAVCDDVCVLKVYGR